MAVAALTIAAGSATSQATPASGQVTPDSATVRKNKKLFSHRDFVMAGLWAGTTLALTPLDKHLAQRLQDPSVQANRFLEHASNGVEHIASPGAYFIGGSLYLIGQVTREQRIADLGWHGTEAVLLGELTSYLIKGTLGRARPFVTIDDPDDFHFGRGFATSRYRSFPSGHSTTAFAAAAAVTDETTLWWPKSTWIVGPLMYGGAAMVGVSRMYHNRHWASDVAVGAMIGTFAGKKVVLASHSSPHNVIDRVMLRGFVAPSEYGAVKIGLKKEF
jgi:membrane-associated phospholipid phosphatase